VFGQETVPVSGLANVIRSNVASNTDPPHGSLTPIPHPISHTTADRATSIAPTNARMTQESQGVR
jgi:hypothetical protein